MDVIRLSIISFGVVSLLALFLMLVACFKIKGQ